MEVGSTKTAAVEAMCDDADDCGDGFKEVPKSSATDSDSGNELQQSHPRTQSLTATEATSIGPELVGRSEVVKKLDDIEGNPGANPNEWLIVER